MHLYGEVLDNYVARDLPQQTLAAIDVHVSNCLFCAHTLANGPWRQPAGSGGACLDASSVTSSISLVVCRGGAAPRDPVPVVLAQRARRILG
jgi:hypothetical protein